MFGVILCLIFRRGNRLRRSMPSGTTYVENDRLLATSSSRWRIDARGLTLLSQFHNKKAGPTSAQDQASPSGALFAGWELQASPMKDATHLLVAQAFHRIKLRGATGGDGAEDNTDDRRHDDSYDR